MSTSSSRTGGFQHELEPHIGDQRRSLVGEQSPLERKLADRQMIAASRGGRPFQGVVG